MSFNPQAKVRELHKAYGHPTAPAEPALRTPVLRAVLILEEAIETAIALVGVAKAQTLVHEKLVRVLEEHARSRRSSDPDLTEALDGCTDLLVVTYGTFEAIGVDAAPFFDEVHRANMAKIGGPRDATGKQLKPPGWSPPDIVGVLRRIQLTNGDTHHRSDCQCHECGTLP